VNEKDPELRVGKSQIRRKSLLLRQQENIKLLSVFKSRKVERGYVQSTIGKR
jgi:hypothetical protein